MEADRWSYVYTESFYDAISKVFNVRSLADYDDDDDDDHYDGYGVCMCFVICISPSLLYISPLSSSSVEAAQCGAA